MFQHMGDARRGDSDREARENVTDQYPFHDAWKITSAHRWCTPLGRGTPSRLRAERKAGELLREREKAKGAAGNPGGRGAPIVRSTGTTTHSPPTLRDLGISKGSVS